MKIARFNTDEGVAFLIYPFVNKEDTPNLSNDWIQVGLDKRFDTIEILNFVKAYRVNAFECSILATCWQRANEIALAMRRGSWVEISFDEPVEKGAQS